MSNFFQSLLDLAEEKPKPTSGSSRDLDSLSQTELVTLCTSLQQQLASKNKDFDQLQAESVVLRKEFDDFRRKADEWQAQMKVNRDNDRRLIEQLRGANQDGEDTEAVMTQALQETVSKLREELRAVSDDRQREARRRTEAELQMQRLEQENKREVTTLRQNFESLKAKTKELQAQAASAEQQHQSQLRVLKSKLGAAQATIADLEAQTVAAASAKAVEMTAPENGKNDASGEEDQQEQDGDKKADSADADAPSSTAVADSQDHEHLHERIRQLQNEHVSLSSRVAAAEAEAAQSSAAATEAKQKLQQLEFDKQDLENTAAQLRAELETQQGHCAKLGAQLEEQEDSFNKSKRQFQQQAQSLESAKEEERGLRAKATARLDGVIAQLRADLAEAQRLAKDKEQLVSDAASKSKAVVAEGETQRVQLEATLLALEGRLQEAAARRTAIESTLAEAQAEVRRRNGIIDDLRQEQDRAQQRLEEAEGQVVVLQKAMATRDRDALSKDRHAQALEAELDGERRAAQQLRQQCEELTAALAAAQVKAVQQTKRADKAVEQLNNSSGINSRSNSDANVASPRAGGDDTVAASARAASSSPSDDAAGVRSPSPVAGGDDADRWASATREWLGRLDHERRVAAEAVRVREEQSAKMRHLESKIDDLTFKLSAAESAAASLPVVSAASGGSGAGGSSGHASVQMPATASSVLLSHGQAWHQQMMSSVQRHTGGWITNRKLMLGLALVFFFVIISFNFVAAGQTARDSKDLETLQTVKEKYFRCLEVVARLEKK